MATFARRAVGLIPHTRDVITSIRRLWMYLRRLAGAPSVRAEATGAPLAHRERVLTVLADVHDSPIVATDRAIHYQLGPSGGGSWHRLGWEQVDDVAWDARRSTLTLLAPRFEVHRIELDLARHDALVELARERVVATTLLRTRVPLDQHVAAIITARRLPGTDQVHWVVTLGGDARNDDARQAQIAAAVAHVRAQSGL